MENVVYLLGAGFSAPLGLPVMSNFLEKSKDLYFSDPIKYKNFENVFKTIREMSIAKNYFSTDLFNIEEILSIIEMKEGLNRKIRKRFFVDYIIQVINNFTPKIMPYPNQLPGNWNDFIFGRDRKSNYYGHFVGNLLNIEIHSKIIQDYRQSKRTFSISIDHSSNFAYSIISLNYDLLIENSFNFLLQNFSNDLNLNIKDGYNIEDNKKSFYLAKLHGCVSSGNIIPPTWNKILYNKEILKAWKLAFQLIKDANHIRILGYSLPITDAYIKYLFKSAIIDSKHLKSIDVICLDDHEKHVESRYNEFIDFKNYRFVSGDILEYLKLIFEKSLKLIKVNDLHNFVKFNSIEEAHKEFIMDHGKKA